MTDGERPPLTGLPRLFSLAAITLAVLAGTLFIVVIVLGSGGVASIADVFGPIAIGATALGFLSAITALFYRRARTLAITALVILIPCLVLSLLTLVALHS